MKTLFSKFVAFACLLLLATTVKAATTVTIADHENLPTTYGTFSGNYLFTTKAASGMAGVTIQATNSDVQMDKYDLSSNQYDYGKGLKLITSDTNSHTITLTAPSGYVIAGYSIGASANSSSYPHTLTAAAGTPTTGSIIGLGSNSNKFQYLTVTEVNSNSTYFTIQTSNGGNTLYVGYFTVTLRKYETSITSGQYYRLHNANYANKAMREQSGVITTETPDDATYSQVWKITTKGSGYSLQNAATGKYIQAATTYSQQFSTGSSSVTFYSGTTTADNLTKFWFSTENSTSSTSYRALHCNASYNVVSWSVTDPSYWYLEIAEVDEDEIAALQNQATLTTGYYRLTSAAYTSLSMADGGGSVTTSATEEGAYTQIWKLTISGSTCTLQNVLTNKYIQSAPGTSVQYQTGTNSYSFNILSKETEGSILYTFQDPNSTWYGLHSAASQNYNVVGWNYASDASYWTLSEVDVDEEDLQELRETLETDYTSQLLTYFSDYACTTLKSTYATMSDASLKSAMSSLPTALQNMAVSVKNETWNSSKGTTWNTYEKDFRIHSYDIFSNSDLWDDITETGPFAHLFHPTGIQASTGDYIYLFVSDDVADSDATLEVECVAGVDRKGAAYTLTKGYNVIYVPYDCEIFVSYLLNNTSKSCTDGSYPDITVHIEGGTMNGCFDMRGHGHTNSDWEWLKTNMFSGTYLHVKGNSTMLNCYRERVVDSSTQDVEGIMNVFDFVFDNLQSLAGCDQWKTTGRYKMMTNNYDVTSGNPHWSTGAYGYAQPGIWYSGIFNYDNLKSVGTNGGNIWVIEHELGHGHQGPINISGQTESSNNSLAQCVNFLTTTSERGQELFTTTRSSRGVGVKTMVERFNQDGGYSWIDYAGYRSDKANNEDVDIWASNRFYFQLWLYFDYMGNYQPTGGNTGFSFINALYDKLRANGITKSTNSSSPALATQDYLLIAKYAAEITETDLSEFFEAWGFWKTEPTISRANDIPASMIWEFPDYSSTYIQTSATQVETIKSAMQEYTKKASNIMFLEDRGTGSTLATYSGAATSTFGDVGYYGTFDNKVTADYTATVSGTTVTMSGGTGAVGFKVYDGDGNLVAISNTTSFTVTSTVATGISDGTYTVKVAQGDGNDYIAASTGHTATHYEEESAVPYAMTDASQLTSSTLFTMNCARGYVYYNGSVLAGTSVASSASKFALVSYDGNTYLYDATQKAFVCHTTAATAGTTGNAALESNSDFSKVVKNISFGTTGIENYPWYMQEDEFTNWLNMNDTPLVYFNRWLNFESGNGGNTYTITITDIDFDDTEAVTMLENYFNPSATVQYIISDSNGVVYTSEVLPATIGETITELPSDMQRVFCSYSTINKTLVSGSNTINVTVTYDLPFEVGTGKLYYATLRGHYVYYDATNNDVRTNQSSLEHTDAYKWSFSGNPYTGIKVKNEATGTYLDNTSNTVQLTIGGYAWTIHRLNSTSTFGLYNGSNYINEQNHTNHNLIYWWQFDGDAGSQWIVEEVPDNYNYATDVVDKVGLFFADDAILDTYFTISSATKAQWLNLYNQYSTTATEEQYHEIVNAINAAIIYPEAGTYRIKSNSGRYMTTTDGSSVTTTTDADDANNIITLTGTYPNFTLTIAGKNVQQYSTNSVTATLSTEAGYSALFAMATPGICTIKNGSYDWVYMHEDASYNVVGWYATNDNSKWTIEKVAYAEGDLNRDGSVDATDLNILIGIIFGTENPSDYNNADLNNDNNYGVGDVTKLVNLMRKDED